MRTAAEPRAAWTCKERQRSLLSDVHTSVDRSPRRETGGGFSFPGVQLRTARVPACSAPLLQYRRVVPRPRVVSNYQVTVHSPLPAQPRFPADPRWRNLGSWEPGTGGRISCAPVGILRSPQVSHEPFV